MKCSEGVNEMSGLGGGGGRLNCKISLIGSILSVRNERSCKNGVLKCIMFGPSHAHLLYVHIFVLYSVSQKSDPSFKLKLFAKYLAEKISLGIFKQLRHVVT